MSGADEYEFLAEAEGSSASSNQIISQNDRGNMSIQQASLALGGSMGSGTGGSEMMRQLPVR